MIYLNKRTVFGTITLFLAIWIFNQMGFLTEVTFDRINAIVIVAIIGMLLTGAYNEVLYLRPENKFILAFFLLYIIEAIISSVNYSQSIISSFFADKFYLIIILFYVLIFCFAEDDKKPIVNKIFIFISAILAVLMVIQVLVLHEQGIEILNIEYNQRLGNARSTSGAHTIEMGVLLSIAYLFSDDKKEKNEFTVWLWRIICIITIVFGTINMFFVSQTRMSIFIVVITVGILILLKDIGLNQDQLLKKGLIVCLAVGFCIWLLNTPVISALLADFEDTSVTVSLRVEEYTLYISQLFSNPFNFLFGTGMIYDKNYTYLTAILGPNGTGGRTDVGIIGFMHEFGFIGLCMYLWVIGRGVNLIRRARRLNMQALDLTAMVSYFILGSGTLCMFNRGRIIDIPIMLFLFCYYSDKIEETEVNSFNIADNSAL